MRMQMLAEQVRSLLKAEGIDLKDKERALASIEECVGKTACKEAYLNIVYPEAFDKTKTICKRCGGAMKRTGLTINSYPQKRTFCCTAEDCWYMENIVDVQR